jgi:aryl-alcohol dehydrogenase-like predicted oxidoreductase
MFTYCNLKDIGILVYSPFMDGRLARLVDTQTERYNALVGTPLDKPRRDLYKEIFKRVEEIIKKRGWTMCHIQFNHSV